MRPYRNRLQWNLKARPFHLIDGLEPAVERLSSRARRLFRARSADLRRTMKVRLVVLILLYIGVIASAVAWVTQVVPAFQVFLDVLKPLSRVLSGLSIVFLGAMILLQRRVAQLEADLVAICIVNHVHPEKTAHPGRQ